MHFQVVFPSVHRGYLEREGRPNLLVGSDKGLRKKGNSVNLSLTLKPAQSWFLLSHIQFSSSSVF